MNTLNEQIERLRRLVRKCYGSVASKGGEIPDAGLMNIENLSKSIESIPNDLKKIIIQEAGTYLPANYSTYGFGEIEVMDVKNIVYLNSLKVTNECIGEDGKWTGEKTVRLVNTTTLVDVFKNCTSLKEIDLRGWDTSQVTSLSSLFAGCTSLERVNLEGIDTRNVSDFSYLFSECPNIIWINLIGTDASKCAAYRGWLSYLGSPENRITLVGDITYNEIVENNLSILNGNNITLPLWMGYYNKASLRAAINGLADRTGLSAGLFSIGNNDDMLGEEERTILANKNWRL